MNQKQQKQNIFIELTITNNCNCKCSYCFEGDHPVVKSDSKVEERQLQLLIEACEKFNTDKYEFLTISFWGGEPFLNLEFLDKIINATYKYSFVRYHCYSNGTLVNKYQEFLSRDYIESIKNRLHIQLSYDGEPHHTIKRGNNSDAIFKVADMLKTLNIQFAFKATLSFDMIKYLPEIWDSYYKLFERYGSAATYYPTLDTSVNDISYLQDWKDTLKKILFKEYTFILNNHTALFGWFNSSNKHNCMLGNSIHMHTDGNIYICHGCAYKEKNKNLLLANINQINSLYDVLSTKYNLGSLPIKCKKCAATHCQICHIVNLSENDNPEKCWLNCRVNNNNRCKYFEYFGYISNVLKYKLISKGFFK